MITRVIITVITGLVARIPLSRILSLDPITTDSQLTVAATGIAFHLIAIVAGLTSLQLSITAKGQSTLMTGITRIVITIIAFFTDP
jgi:hypothetical protein